MRAAVFKGAGIPFVIEELPDPEPGEGEAVMRVGRCGICGTDLHMTSGHATDFPAGTVLGHEYARITASGAVHLPQALSLADGALVEPLAVGLGGVRVADMRPGARVLVLGAGSVGLASIYWARRLGAGRIVAASPSARRREMAENMGADAFETLGEGAAERINAALGGPAEVIFECAGVVGVLQNAIELAGPNGMIVSLGFCLEPDPIMPAVATWKQVNLRFAFAYTLEDFQYCTDFLDRGHVEPRQMISRTVSLDALPDIFEGLRAGGQDTKVHVDPWMT